VRTTPFVILDGDCDPQNEKSSQLSFISCLLKFASGCYDAHIDILALNLQEWQRVTKWSPRQLGSDEDNKNTRFLNKLETLLHREASSETFQSTIHSAIRDYFNMQFELKIVDKLKEEGFSPGICWLYKKKGEFRLILERKERDPIHVERAQKLMEDLRESSFLEEYFHSALNTHAGDAFLIRKKYLEYWDNLMESEGVVDSFDKLGISYKSCPNLLCKLLMECEDEEIPSRADKGERIIERFFFKCGPLHLEIKRIKIKKPNLLELL